MALNSGRIAHSHSKTLNLVTESVERALTSLGEALAVSNREQRAQREAYTNLLKVTNDSLVSALTDTLALPQTQGLREEVERFTRKLCLDDNIGYLLDILCEKLGANAISGSSNPIVFQSLVSPVQLYLQDWVAIEQTFNNLDSIDDQSRDHCQREIFTSVLRQHALDHSEMFESFRTRIRHGWLIASLKDCFARFDLYNQGGEEVLTHQFSRHLDGLTDEVRTAFSAELGDLRQTFLELVERLHLHWLWLKDPDHPEGMLDFDLEHFDLDGLYHDHDIQTTAIEPLIRALCQAVDDRAQGCFAAIRALLRERVLPPLLSHLDSIETLLDKHKEAFRTAQDGLTSWGKIHNDLQAARDEFLRRMQDYQAWFDFEESAVRDFTLPEIIRLAWEVTSDVDGVRLKRHRIQTPRYLFDEDANKLFLQGAGFSDLMEVFKVLFQNVVYHANPQPESNTLTTTIEVHIETDLNVHPTRLAFTVASTCSAGSDPSALLVALNDQTERRKRMHQKQGSGLATVQETLMNRLPGVAGKILDLSCQKRKCKPGSPWFSVEAELFIHEPGSSWQPSPEEAGFFRALPLEDLLEQARLSGLKALIIEDQEPKYLALKAYLRERLPDAVILNTWDMETSARLLIHPGVRFDLVLLDMTLPTEPSPDAPLKPLAGLALLKIMSIRKVCAATIIVTQYSNWQSEAKQDTRQYIEDLSARCHHDFKQNFLGAIRFSHTELSWRKGLDALLDKRQPIDQTDWKRQVQDLEDRLKKRPQDRNIRRQLARLYLDLQDFRQALLHYRQLEHGQIDDPELYSGLALTYSGLGMATDAQEALDRYRAISGTTAENLQQKLLTGQLQHIDKSRQLLRQDEMMTTLGRIARGIAHEFRTPLQTILAHSGFAKTQLPPITESNELAETFSAIDQQVRRMNAMIEHIEGLAKGNKEIRSATNLNEVIQQALRFHDEQFKRRGIKLELKLLDKLPPVHANALLLEQVFINLTLNAIDALEAFSKERSSCDEPSIYIETRRLIRDGYEWVRVRFADNGPGIADGLGETLFLPFETSKEPGKGMGLGLTIARDTLKELGGDIFLDESHSPGACFLIEIPSQQPSQELNHAI